MKQKNQVVEEVLEKLIEKLEKLGPNSYKDFVLNRLKDSKIEKGEILLQKDMKFHFKEEEKLQKDVGYPGLEEHIKKHEEFRHTVKVLYDYLDENEGPDEKFMEQVKINVIDWLFGHIKTFDRSVAEYINIYDNPDRL